MGQGWSGWKENENEIENVNVKGISKELSEWGEWGR